MFLPLPKLILRGLPVILNRDGVPGPCTPLGGPHEADDASNAPEGVDHVSRVHTGRGGVSQG